MVAMTEETLHWAYLGRISFGRAVELQERLREEIRAGRGGDRLLLLEHSHVYTLGRSASRSDILMDLATARARGIEVAECDRGGQVTYHGPGQLVGYPILNLDPDRRDVRRYVQNLQEVLVRTLDRFGVDAEAKIEQPLIGVWVGRRKIASIGIHLSRWITTHGFALNVTTDLEFFRWIVPCGSPRIEVTSIEELTHARPSVSDVATICAEEFSRVFNRTLTPSTLPLEEGLWAIKN
jgi:lipoyl(octanoyl) transferase